MAEGLVLGVFCPTLANRPAASATGAGILEEIRVVLVFAVALAGGALLYGRISHLGTWLTGHFSSLRMNRRFTDSPQNQPQTEV